MGEDFLGIKDEYLHFNNNNKKVETSKIDWKAAIKIIEKNNLTEDVFIMPPNRTDIGSYSFELKLFDYTIHLNWYDEIPNGKNL